MDAAAVNSAELIDRFGGLLKQVAGPEDVALLWQKAATGLWQLIISTTDKDGLLTVMAGLLTASTMRRAWDRMLSLWQGFAFTITSCSGFAFSSVA